MEMLKNFISYIYQIHHWEVINNDADVYATLRKIMAPEIIKSL